MKLLQILSNQTDRKVIFWDTETDEEKKIIMQTQNLSTGKIVESKLTEKDALNVAGQLLVEGWLTS